jgi:hypothetical protein
MQQKKLMSLVDFRASMKRKWEWPHLIELGTQVESGDNSDGANNSARQC